MYKELISEWSSKSILTAADKLSMLVTVMEVYPLIVLSNLSTNEYVAIRNKAFLHTEIPATGKFDEMIDDGVVDVHKNYQELFSEFFDRNNLIKEFSSGKKEVYAEIYQKKHGSNGYHWISSHAIRLNDSSGDYILICLNRELPDKVDRKASRK